MTSVEKLSREECRRIYQDLKDRMQDYLSNANLVQDPLTYLKQERVCVVRRQLELRQMFTEEQTYSPEDKENLVWEHSDEYISQMNEVPFIAYDQELIFLSHR